jgi:dihydroorotate dehydrogenase electron transfer subunit
MLHAGSANEAANRGVSGLRAALPVVLTVGQVRREHRDVVTLFFPLAGLEDAAQRGLDLAAFQPGQFFMVWVPRLDEKPYTISYLDAEQLGMTVQKRGPFSTRLCELQPGAKVGLRGPYGRPFWDMDKYAASRRVALFGGGCGMATIGLLAERLPQATIVQGARSAEVLLFLDRFRDQFIFTDDGSAGRQGFPAEWLEEQVQAGAVDMVYACGPEAMLAGLADICRRVGIGCQVSMERYMKCGIGVCGQCDCDGRLVCTDGPTFTAEELSQMPSFGHRRRDKAGRPVEVVAEPQCPTGPGAQPAAPVG